MVTRLRPGSLLCTWPVPSSGYLLWNVPPSPLLPSSLPLSLLAQSLRRSLPHSPLFLAPSMPRSVPSSLIPFSNPPSLPPPSTVALSLPAYHHRFLPPSLPSLPPSPPSLPPLPPSLPPSISPSLSPSLTPSLVFPSSLPPSPCSLPPILHPSWLLLCLPPCLPAAVQFNVHRMCVWQAALYRPLSRRLDRCDRMIQNEGNDSTKLFTLKKALCRYGIMVW